MGAREVGDCSTIYNPSHWQYTPVSHGNCYHGNPIHMSVAALINGGDSGAGSPRTNATNNLDKTFPPGKGCKSFEF